MRIAYPGLERPISLRYTAQHGFVPGVIEIRCGPQLNLPALVGPVFFTDDNNTVTLYDCKLDSAGIEISSNGHVERIRLFDRRWRWNRFGEISGTYNIRNPDDSIVIGTEKSPQELAILAFQALGETNFDVSELPNDANDRPFVNWECFTPQYVLDWLCRRAGCDLAPDWHANTMRIVRLGQGGLLPSELRQTVNFGLDVGETPDVIKICAGYELHQNRFELEAVGLETYGTWNNLDNLSYGSDLAQIANPYDPIPDLTNATRVLAKTYTRNYRVKSFADGSLKLPATGEEFPDAASILPVRNKLAEGYTLPDGTQQDADAYVTGIFLTGSLDDPDSLQNTFDEDERLEGIGFTIDQETGIVTFSSPVVKLRDDNDGFEEATLFLTTSHYVRNRPEDANPFQYRRYTRERQIGSFGTPPYVVRRDDVVPRFITDWQLTRVAGTSDNLAQINPILDAHLNAIQSEFANEQTAGAQYGALMLIRLDGAIRQVTWEIYSSGRRKGAYTSAYRNVEWEPGIPRRRERSRVIQIEHNQRVLVEDQTRRRKAHSKGEGGF